MTKKKSSDDAGTPLTDIPTKKDEHFAFCKTCNGKGFDPADATKLCPNCQGSGMVKA